MTMFGSPWFGSAGEAFTIDQSCRFTAADTSYLTWTPGDAPDSRRIFTFSFWMKRGILSTTQQIHTESTGADGGNASFGLYMRHDNKLCIYQWPLEKIRGYYERANTNDWMHVVEVIDTTQATDTNRIKLYIDGAQITTFGATNYPAQNADMGITQSGVVQCIGATSGSNYPIDMYLAEFHFLDGIAAAVGDFGETVDGVWVPKEYGGSYGGHGYYMDFADSADLGADQSGNSNDFTSSGLDAADQVLDSPSNNFAVFNPSDTSGTTLTYSECNLKAERTSSSFAQAYSSMSFDSGKWYAEVIFDTGNSDAGIIAGEANPGSNRYLGQDSYTYALYPGDGRKVNSASYSAYGVGITKAADGSGDVLGIYIDADNGDIYFSKNGTVMNSGTAAFTGVTGPFRISVDSESSSFAVINFGQDDTFAGLKTSGSAAASDDNGYGKFYDTIALAGYLAPCSKNGGTV